MKGSTNSLVKLSLYNRFSFSLITNYSGVLTDIIADWPQSPMPVPESYYRSPTREENENENASEISERIAWLILVVLCKLDGKAELHKEVALSYLFLANNMQYVVVKVRRSNLRFLLGEEWLANHELKVREYVSKYERVAWNKVVAALPENPTAAGEVAARACFVAFNAAFREECRKQSSWVISDPKLREEIKGSIGSMMVLKYSDFFERNRVGLESGMGILPGEIGHYLNDILRGNEDSGSVSWSHSSSSTAASSPHRYNRR